MRPKRITPTMMTKGCRECGETFSRYASNADGDFCSYPCWIQFRRKNSKPRVGTCEWCGGEFVNRPTGPMNRFCGRSCAGKFHSLRFSRHIYTCDNCGGEFERQRNPGRYQTKKWVFCSQKCGYEHRKSRAKEVGAGRPYVWTRLPDGTSIQEHRLVAEQMVVCRPLRDDEVVHHRNEVKTDNRPENLAVVTRSEHSAYHLLKRLGFHDLYDPL